MKILVIRNYGYSSQIKIRNKVKFSYTFLYGHSIDMLSASAIVFISA